jgi:hypothetical protein
VEFYAADGANAADWLEAWATVVGAVLSAGAVLVAVLVVRQEQKHRREDKLEAEMAQARLLVNKVISIAGSSKEGWLGVAYEVFNHSSNRITDIHTEVFLTDAYEVHVRDDVGELGPGERHREQVTFDEPLPWPFLRIGPLSRPPVWTPGGIGRTVEMQTRFVDSSGLRWYRMNDQEPRHSVPRIRVSTWFLLADYLHLATAFSWCRDLVNRAARRLRRVLNQRLKARIDKRTGKVSPGLAATQALPPQPSADTSNVEGAASE